MILLSIRQVMTLAQKKTKQKQEAMLLYPINVHRLDTWIRQ